MQHLTAIGNTLKNNPEEYKPQGLMKLLEDHMLRDFVPVETKFDRALVKLFEAQDRNASELFNKVFKK